VFGPFGYSCTKWSSRSPLTTLFQSIRYKISNLRVCCSFRDTCAKYDIRLTAHTVECEQHSGGCVERAASLVLAGGSHHQKVAKGAVLRTTEANRHCMSSQWPQMTPYYCLGLGQKRAHTGNQLMTDRTPTSESDESMGVNMERKLHCDLRHVFGSSTDEPTNGRFMYNRDVY